MKSAPPFPPFFVVHLLKFENPHINPELTVYIAPPFWFSFLTEQLSNEHFDILTWLEKTHLIAPTSTYGENVISLKSNFFVTSNK